MVYFNASSEITIRRIVKFFLLSQNFITEMAAIAVANDLCADIPDISDMLYMGKKIFRSRP